MLICMDSKNRFAGRPWAISVAVVVVVVAVAVVDAFVFEEKSTDAASNGL